MPYLVVDWMCGTHLLHSTIRQVPTCSAKIPAINPPIFTSLRFLSLLKVQSTLLVDGIIRLDATLDRLDYATHDGQNQDENRDPEGKPLHSLPPIDPPLTQRTGLRLIEDLLQHVKPSCQYLKFSIWDGY